MAAKLTTTIAIGLSAVLLASCAGTELDNTRGMETQGGTFNAALYEGYLDRAQHEYSYGDYNHSDVFARKAQQAAAGQTVRPFALDSDMADAMDGKMPAIRQARSDLMSALNRTARQKSPEAAAEAQVAFDCWLEETQPSHIQECRDRFDQSLKTAQAALQPAKTAQAPETPEQPQQPESPEPESFTVYFGFDSAQLSQDARDVLNQVADAAQDRQDAEISATGFTDTVGPEDYNQNLSFRRAQAVKDALTDRGIAGDRVGTAARGENELAVDTADGVREPRNRRVEISLF